MNENYCKLKKNRVLKILVERKKVVWWMIEDNG